MGIKKQEKCSSIKISYEKKGKQENATRICIVLESIKEINYFFSVAQIVE